jgi:phage recombination protein Bet
MNEIAKNRVHTIDVAKLQTYLNAMGMANNLTKGEFEQFVEIAQGFGLNPFKREIYANKYGDKFSVIVGYETYIKRAERSGLLAGWSVVTTGSVNMQKPKESTLVATITIHRKDFQFPFVHEVHFSEYFGTRRDGTLTDFWKNKPVTMTKKVAMAQGFRLCFSDELGGMPYTAEELNAMEAETIQTNNQATKQPLEQKPVINVDVLIAQIEAAKSKSDLIDIWKKHPEHHGNPVFKTAMTDRKKALEAPTPGAANSSDENSIEHLIDQIMTAETTEMILELTIDNTNPDVMDAAMTRLEQINGGVQTDLFEK